ncbi:pentapeptide repeat-containing protein [Yoonia sp. R2331]|uniref:pentapeptide repeat-containing protein n=1 Tax=Yoonia sp. R2331 TaxID=3237238 RepID=UPI0034E506B9
MKFEIRSRWTGAVRFTAEIEADESASLGVKVGLAVKWAIKNDAVLSDADLSGADLRDADLRDAVLSDADLSGADLRDADLRDADLRDADLRDADLRDADLRDADLRGADLSDADLRGAVLSGAVLRGADLSGADLRDCPVKIENIHTAIYEAASQPGALKMETWHCGTAHCRAGWAVTLAGEGGKALEFAMGTPAAAAVIYLASDPSLERMPNFYTTNEKALADMKRLAELEAKAHA